MIQSLFNMEKTPEDEEFERMLAKIDLQHTPSKDSQLVSLRRWEIDEMIRLAVLAEREECIKIVMQGTGEPIQRKTLDILQQERTRIALSIKGQE